MRSARSGRTILVAPIITIKTGHIAHTPVIVLLCKNLTGAEGADNYKHRKSQQGVVEGKGGTSTHSCSKKRYCPQSVQHTVVKW